MHGHKNMFVALIKSLEAKGGISLFTLSLIVMVLVPHYIYYDYNASMQI